MLSTPHIHGWVLSLIVNIIPDFKNRNACTWHPTPTPAHTHTHTHPPPALPCRRRNELMNGWEEMLLHTRDQTGGPWNDSLGRPEPKWFPPACQHILTVVHVAARVFIWLVSYIPAATSLPELCVIRSSTDGEHELRQHSWEKCERLFTCRAHINPFWPLVGAGERMTPLPALRAWINKKSCLHSARNQQWFLGKVCLKTRVKTPRGRSANNRWGARCEVTHMLTGEGWGVRKHFFLCQYKTFFLGTSILIF